MPLTTGPKLIDAISQLHDRPDVPAKARLVPYKDTAEGKRSERIYRLAFEPSSPYKTRRPYYKDNPETKRAANASRRTVLGVRIYPSHPLYTAATGERQEPVLVHPELTRIRAERRAMYALKDVEDMAVKDGFVYIVRSRTHPDVIKIGKSRDPERRLSSAKAFVYPRDQLHLHSIYFSSDASATEKAVHKFFAKSRLEGEWFMVPPATAGYIIKVLLEAQDADV